MSRYKGSLLEGTFDSSKRFPVDSRELVSTKADLINPSIWIVNTLTSNALYNGLCTTVNNDGENNGKYRLSDRTLITEENYNAYLAAVEAGEETDSYFKMWHKIAELSDVESLDERIDTLESDKIEKITNTELEELLK